MSAPELPRLVYLDTGEICRAAADGSANTDAVVVSFNYGRDADELGEILAASPALLEALEKVLASHPVKFARSEEHGAYPEIHEAQIAVARARRRS